MLSEDQLKYHMSKYCESGRLQEIEGYAEAISSPEKYVLHHRMEIQPDGTKLSKQWMIDHDIYYGLHPCMLVFMKDSEHRKLHAPRKKLYEHTSQRRSHSSQVHSGEDGIAFHDHYGIWPYENRPLWRKEVGYKKYHGNWRWEGIEHPDRRLGKHPERGDKLSAFQLKDFGKEFFERTGMYPKQCKKLYKKLYQQHRLGYRVSWEDLDGYSAG